MGQRLCLFLACASVAFFCQEAGIAQAQQPSDIQIKEEIARLRNEGSFLLSEVGRAEHALDPYRKLAEVEQAYGEIESRRKEMQKFLLDLEPVFTAAEDKQDTSESLKSQIHQQRDRLGEILRKQQSAIADWSLSAAPSPRDTVTIDSEPSGSKAAASTLWIYQFAFGTFLAQVPGPLRPGEVGRTTVRFTPTSVFGGKPAGKLSIIPHTLRNPRNLTFDPVEFSIGNGKPGFFLMDEPALSDMNNPMQWTWTTIPGDDFSGASFEIPFEVLWTPTNGDPSSAWAQVGIEISAPPKQRLFGIEELLGDIRVGIVGAIVGFPLLRLLEWLTTWIWKRWRGDKQSGGMSRATAGC